VTQRANTLALDQLAALLAEADTKLLGLKPGEGVTLDPSGTVRAFRANHITAGELRVVATAASALASAAYEAAIGDLADSLITERRRGR
jgi:hypothetical protein